MTSLALSCLLFSSPSRADTPDCVPGSPGSDGCAHQEPVMLAPQLFERPREKRLRDFFIPNGNLTPAGDFAVSVQALGLYNMFTYGLNKHVELSVSAPLVPAIIGIGGRVALIPPGGKLRAVIGTAFHFLPSERDEFWLQGTATVAYHDENFEAHANVNQIYHDKDGFKLPAANIGGSVRLRYNLAVHANYGSVNFNGVDGGLRRCDPCQNPRWNALALGAKYMGRRWDADFGFFFVMDPDAEKISPAPVPFFSAHRMW